MRKLTLEERIARLEKLIMNEDVENGEFRTAREVMAAIDNGWDPNHKGFTALMSAAIDNNPAVVRALIRAGANVNAKTRDGSTALDFATANDSTKVEPILIAAGAEYGKENQARIAKGDKALRGWRNPYGSNNYIWQ